MKKGGLQNQIRFFKDSITEYNYITEIISDDDRSKKTIEDLKNYVAGTTSDPLKSETLSRILTYFKATNAGIKMACTIMFRNGHIWNVEYTSSERSDRTEGLAARLSRNRSDKNYIVIGDYGRSKSNRTRPVVDPRNNLQVVSMEEFVDDLLYEIYSYTKDGAHKIPLSKSPLSQINGLRGPFWEECVAECIREQGIFLPVLYDQLLDIIMHDEKFTLADIASTTAKRVGTSRKKTDVAIKIILHSGRTINKTIGVKASGQDKVSLHQAKAKDFISTLGISDPTVMSALTNFEKYGNASGLSNIEEAALNKYFSQPKEYQDFLNWCFKGPSGSLDYLIIHSYERDDRKVCCHTKTWHVDDYMAMVKKKAKVDTEFGTGLQWTYKRIKKTKRNEIQLKVPLIYY